jgi:uncharacterized protein with HEPN domain
MPDDLMFIGHMVDMAKRAQRMVAGASRADLDTDDKLQLALVRALQIIGEAAWRTSEAFQNAHPSIPWRQISAFRHRVVHDYFAVDYDVVWKIATMELQPLIDKLEPLLPSP